MNTLLRIAAALSLLGSTAYADDADPMPPSPLAAAIASAAWTTVAPGIDRLALTQPLDLLAFRIAPGAAKLRVVPQQAPEGSTAADIATLTKADFVINGGFFWVTPKASLAPTGLLIAEGRTLNARRPCRTCTGLIYADKAGIHIVRERTLKSTRGITDAMQVGPMLVEHGAVLPFQPDGPAAERSAVCLDGARALYVVAVFGTLTLHDLAELMRVSPREGGFGCEMALNLDGGSSTQMAVTLGGKVQSLGSSRPVQNFLAFYRK